MGIQTPSEQINTISKELDITDAARRLAERIADDVQDNPDVWGRAPSSVAAATIYVATHLSGEKQTQADISAATGCSVKPIQEIHPIIVEHIENMDNEDGASEDSDKPTTSMP